MVNRTINLSSLRLPMSNFWQGLANLLGSRLSLEATVKILEIISNATPLTTVTGHAGNRTQIGGFKVPSANHYTTQPISKNSVFRCQMSRLTYFVGKIFVGRLAQMVERLLSMQEVLRSILRPPKLMRDISKIDNRAKVEQFLPIVQY